MKKEKKPNSGSLFAIYLFLFLKCAMIGTAFRKKVPAMRMSSSIKKKINHSKNLPHDLQRNRKASAKQEIMRRLGAVPANGDPKAGGAAGRGSRAGCRRRRQHRRARARAFSIVKDARLAVGLDINQDYYTAVLVDLLGSVICSKRQRFPFSQSDDYYRQIGLAVLELIDSVTRIIKGSSA